MVFDNEVTDCLVVRLTFSVVRLELLVLIGGFHEFLKVFSWTVLVLAFHPTFGDRDSVGDIFLI